MTDRFLEEALREVDAIAPAAPPVATLETLVQVRSYVEHECPHSTVAEHVEKCLPDTEPLPSLSDSLNDIKTPGPERPTHCQVCAKPLVFRTQVERERYLWNHALAHDWYVEQGVVCCPDCYPKINQYTSVTRSHPDCVRLDLATMQYVMKGGRRAKAASVLLLGWEQALTEGTEK